MKKLLLLLLLTCSTSLFCSETKLEIKIIPIKSIDFNTVKEFCTPMLTDKGRLVYLKHRKAVYVFDRNSVIKKVEEFISAADTPQKNLQIRIENLESGKKKSSKFGLKSDDQWGLVIKDGKVDLPSIDGVDLEKKTANSTKNNTMTLTTLSGHPATLYVGEEISDITLIETYLLDPSVRLKYNGRPYVYKKVNYERRFLGSSLMMKPILLENGNILVEVYPEVSYLNNKNKKYSIAIESLKTAVVARPNQRIKIGGNIKSKSDGYKNIFGPDFFESSSGKSVLNIYLTAKVLQ